MKIVNRSFNCYGKSQIWLFQQVYDFIMGLEEGVTCDTTVDAEFNNEDPSHQAIFNFTIRNKMHIRVYRPYANDETTNSPTAWLLKLNDQDIAIREMNTWRSGGYPSTVCGYDNYYYMKAVITDNFVGIWVNGTWNSGSSTPFPTNWKVALISDGENSFVGANNSDSTTNIASFNYYDATSFEGAYNIKVVLPFQAGPGEIYYSELTPIVPATGAGNTYNLGDLVSCSTVTIGSSIALANGKNYWAISPNLMLKVPEE